jgi:formylglycine-generating enzyme required for sulfatase activity
MTDSVKVFVSYSHQDTHHLEGLLGLLKSLENEGVEFWMDRKICTGELGNEAIKANIQDSAIVLALVSQSFLDSPYGQDVEIGHFLAQQKHLFPVILSPCDWKRHTWLSSRQFLPGDDETIEEHYTDQGRRKRLFLKIREQLQERAELIQTLASVQPSTLMPQPTWTAPPYPGLRHFTEDEVPIFFGRGSEIRELLDRLANPDNRFIAVIGASGSGKSSLVTAGLLPRLSEIPGGKDWIRVCFTPGGLGDDPFWALAVRLEPLLEKHGLKGRDIASQLEFSGDPTELVQIILKDQPDATGLLLFIDQFEELFTLTAPEYQRQFITLLVKAAEEPQVRTVLTLRADFYPRCVEDARLVHLLRVASYPLAVPELSALLEMITRPATLAGLRFEEGLPGRILEDAGREPGALALLAFALAELYKARQPDGTLTHAAYDRFNGVKGAISRRVEATCESFDADTQAAFEEVFRELVKVDEQGVATRRRVSLEQVIGSVAAQKLIDAFAGPEARLLVCNRTGQTPTVEVAHEVLLTSWPHLKEWIEVRRDDLRLLRQVRLATQEWDKHDRAKPYLWLHERLLPVSQMLNRLRPTLNSLEKEFVRPESERRLEEIANPVTSHQQRAKIGGRLAEISDPRPGVGLNKAGLPAFAWCKVPGGKVTLEGNAGTFQVELCYIAKYPVTWIQYRCFLEAEDGYRHKHWWKGLAERQDNPGEQYQLLDNHPAENVSWYDAVTFCRWLSARLSCEIRLPTEWEWQQAATGGNPANVYPWGADWNSAYANTWESRLGRTTAVGLYPQGASPVGALDLSGNVWEWCLNDYSNPQYVDLSGANRRVARGGCWYHGQDRARSAFRDLYYPNSRSADLGFRVVCLSPSFELLGTEH